MNNVWKAPVLHWKFSFYVLLFQKHHPRQTSCEEMNIYENDFQNKSTEWFHLMQGWHHPYKNWHCVAVRLASISSTETIQHRRRKSVFYLFSFGAASHQHWSSLFWYQSSMFDKFLKEEEDEGREKGSPALVLEQFLLRVRLLHLNLLKSELKNLKPNKPNRKEASTILQLLHILSHQNLQRFIGMLCNRPTESRKREKICFFV